MGNYRFTFWEVLTKGGGAPTLLPGSIDKMSQHYIIES